MKIIWKIQNSNIQEEKFFHSYHKEKPSTTDLEKAELVKLEYFHTGFI